MSQKQLSEMELCVKELLTALRKAKYQHETLVDSLKEFEQVISDVRRERFDAVNSPYGGY